MNHIINPWVFYWISVCDILKCVALIAVIISAFASILLVGHGFDRYTTKDEQKTSMNLAKIFGGLLVISISMTIFIPSEETCYKMLAADMFTQENIDIASDYVTDVIDYAVDKVKDLKDGETSDHIDT